MSVINPVPEDEKVIIWPLVGKKMLELGNKKNPNGVYKTYFESLGIEHISVDWNGEDGALKLDLRQPLKLGQFDMITNIGTTEHVSDQEPVWRNIHEACKIGGVIASLTPLEGDWWWHGEWYPREDFFKQFAGNGYEIEFLGIGREHPNRNLMCRLKKTEDKSFEMPNMDTFFFNHRKPR